MDRAVCQRLGERVVDETVLLDEREPLESGAYDRHLEMIAAARAIGDRDLSGLRERMSKKLLEARAHPFDDSSIWAEPSLPARLSSPLLVFTIGHGTRPVGELVACLLEAGVGTLVDVRRFPSSRRHPQFNQAPLRDVVEAAGIGYRHAEALGGRRSAEPGEDRFPCIRESAFRSYAARMALPDFQEALAASLAEPPPCFLCAETLWWRCHRRLIAELLVARGHAVRHLIRAGEQQAHRVLEEAESRAGRLYLCGELVA